MTTWISCGLLWGQDSRNQVVVSGLNAHVQAKDQRDCPPSCSWSRVHNPHWPQPLCCLSCGMVLTGSKWLQINQLFGWVLIFKGCATLAVKPVCWFPQQWFHRTPSSPTVKLACSIQLLLALAVPFLNKTSSDIFIFLYVFAHLVCTKRVTFSTTQSFWIWKNHLILSPTYCTRPQ